jgi:hypothetical protein
LRQFYRLLNPTPSARRDLARRRRRAEIADLNVEDLDFGRSRFLIIAFRKSKTDRGGVVQFVAVPRLVHGPCAVAAVEAWLTVRERKKGALFVALSPHGELRDTRIEGRLVAEVVKRLFRGAGAVPGDARLLERSELALAQTALFDPVLPLTIVENRARFRAAQAVDADSVLRVTLCAVCGALAATPSSTRSPCKLRSSRSARTISRPPTTGCSARPTPCCIPIRLIRSL